MNLQTIRCEAAVLATVCLSAGTTAALADNSGTVLEPAPAAHSDITPQKFVREATIAGDKEIRLGEIAIERAQNPEVKQMARQLVRDHREANETLTELCRDKGLNSPDTSTMRSTIHSMPEQSPPTARGAGYHHVEGMSEPRSYEMTDTTRTTYWPRSGLSRSFLDDQPAGSARGGATRQLALTIGTPGDFETADRSERYEVGVLGTPAYQGTIETEPTGTVRGGGTARHMESTSTTTAIGDYSTELPQTDRQSFRHIQTLSGSEFDRAYVREMVNDHRKAVALFENANENLQDQELKSFADDTLPKLREHLRMAEDLSSQLGESH